jgi:hypothetical protein
MRGGEDALDSNQHSAVSKTKGGAKKQLAIST